VFTIRQHSSASSQKCEWENIKIIWRKMALAHMCLTENKHDLAEVFFPSHQRGKFKETSTKKDYFMYLYCGFPDLFISRQKFTQEFFEKWIQTKALFMI